jgi:amino acid adenylation domain-containing protein
MLTVIDRFQAVVARQPHAPALVSDETATVTYKELSDRAMHIAGMIDGWFVEVLGRPAGAQDTIAISLDKGPDLYAAILGILNTGASYVPVDPALPVELQSHILQTCGSQLMLASGVHACAAADKAGMEGSADMTAVAVIYPDCARPPLTGLSVICKPGAHRRQVDHRCYTIFTSGSTGRPKGVQITDRNLLNLVDWVQGEFSLGTGNRVLQYSTINFDASVLDIFPTLLAGAVLCIPSADQRMSATLLEEFCAHHHVDHAFLPPALLGALHPMRFPTLRHVLTGGEACSPGTIASWMPGRRFHNLYGPTECTVLVTSKTMGDNISPTNIGQAIAGVRLHVLDEQMRPAARGELHVGGQAVSPGYVGDEAQTQRKFIMRPELDKGPLYKTGDIVERDVAGDLHFIGRVDRQVKVRGYRVELEEIEGELTRLGCLQAALKLTKQGALAAYVVLPHSLSIEDLRRLLTEALAEFKIPSFFIELASLPQKHSGKIDFDALLDPSPSAEVPMPGASDKLESLGVPGKSSEPTFPAQDNNHAPLVALWSESLGVRPQLLHAGSNFRELGGTSIKIVRLLSTIERHFHIRISFPEFFRNPTLGFLFTAIEQRQT